MASEPMPLSRHSQPAVSLGPCFALYHDASVAQLLVKRPNQMRDPTIERATTRDNAILTEADLDAAMHAQRKMGFDWANGRISAARMHKLISWFYAVTLVGLVAALALAEYSGASEINIWGTLAIVLIALALFVLHRVAAWGAYVNKPWGRTLTRVIATIMLAGFPLGTAMGLVLLGMTRAAAWPKYASGQVG